MISEVIRINPKGANFCHVDINRIIGQDNDSMTWGTQMWNGKAPSLRTLAAVNSSVINKGEVNGDMRGINSRVVPAISCKIKYFIAISDEDEDFLIVIKGMIEIRFMTRPIHVRIHQDDKNTSKVPNKVVMIERIIHAGNRGRA